MDEVTKNVNFLDQVAGDGLDAIGSNDLPKPFIKIAQKGNPEVDERDPNYVPGLKMGQFFNSLTKEVYGDNINVIILYYEKAWLVYEPNRGSFKGKYPVGAFKTIGNKYAKDKEDKLKDEQGNTVIEAMIFYVLNADKPNDGIAILTLYSSGIKHASNWLFSALHAIMPSGNPAPLYGHVWNLKLEYNTNADGSWFTIGVGNTTAVTKGALLPDLPNGQELFEKYVDPSRKLLLAGGIKTDFAQLENSDRMQIAEDAGKY